jgi:predicted ArsR family transcriptional regulator
VAALSQPTRARIFARLAASPQPLATEALATQLQLHPNGVRLHLERLQNAGLIQRQRQRLARGRPRDLWSISAEAQPTSGPPTGYGALSGWLVRLLRAAAVDSATITLTGEEIGREVAARCASDVDAGASASTGADGAGAPPNGDPDRPLLAALTSLGFAPQSTRTGRRSVYSLRNCPYERSVSAGEKLVCELHRSITGGLVAALEPDAELLAFTARDPHEDCCSFCVQSPAPARTTRTAGA